MLQSTAPDAGDEPPELPEGRWTATDRAAWNSLFENRFYIAPTPAASLDFKPEQRVSAELIAAALCSGLAGNGSCVIRDTAFRGGLRLSKCEFETLLFDGCHFEGLVQILDVNVDGRLSFENCVVQPLKLPASIGFSGDEIPTLFQLERVTCGELIMAKLKVHMVHLVSVAIARDCLADGAQFADRFSPFTWDAGSCCNLRISKLCADTMVLRDLKITSLDGEGTAIKEFSAEHLTVRQNLRLSGDALASVTCQRMDCNGEVHLEANKSLSVEMLDGGVKGRLWCRAEEVKLFRMKKFNADGGLTLWSASTNHCDLQDAELGELVVSPRSKEPMGIRTLNLENVRAKSAKIGPVSLEWSATFKRLNVQDELELRNWIAPPTGSPIRLITLVECDIAVAKFWRVAARTEAQLALQFTRSRFGTLNFLGPLPEQCDLGDSAYKELKVGPSPEQRDLPVFRNPSDWWRRLLLVFKNPDWWRLLLSFRNPDWSRRLYLYEDLLERGPFAPLPYRQLARCLESKGETSYADDVLLAERIRETRQARRTGQWGRWLQLEAQRAIVGFGIGRHVSRVLFWIMVLTLVGAIVLRFGPQGDHLDWPWCFGASLSRLLPVPISPRFTEFFQEKSGVQITYWQNAYFALHTLLGWVLSAYVAATLTGLLQKRKS